MKPDIMHTNTQESECERKTDRKLSINIDISRSDFSDFCCRDFEMMSASINIVGLYISSICNTIILDNYVSSGTKIKKMRDIAIICSTCLLSLPNVHK